MQSNKGDTGGTMRILIAEDDHVSGRLLDTALKKAGHETILVTDGDAALEAITSDGAPTL